MRFHGSRMTSHDGPRTPSHHADGSTQQPTDDALDNVCAAVRCVVAAETYRLTGTLPEWARNAGHACSEPA